MGKYINKASVTPDVDQSIGVRTRAKTLALRHLQSSAADSGYLQLRSRRLEKSPLYVKRKNPNPVHKQKQGVEEAPTGSGLNIIEPKFETVGDEINSSSVGENDLCSGRTESEFSFGEVGCMRTRTKLTCCDFSSDGKLLASAGHEKKVVLWNMDTLQTETTPEEHQSLITDVRFRPNSTQLATASFDKSVRLWDAAHPNYCIDAYTGHTSHVMSLDFHPRKTDLFCFCDSNNEIRYWDINPFSCTRISKQGGSVQVRFQPITGHLLAAASENTVSIYDVETDRQTHLFQGPMFNGFGNYLCWDLDGNLLASVSENSIKVLALNTGKCIYELNSNGNQFHSCVFHPSYSALLVIGGSRSFELWNTSNNKSMIVPAHENIIADLAQSPQTGMVASVSHDSSLKLWK